MHRDVPMRIAAMVCFVAALVLFGAAIVRGDLEGGLFIIFPFMLGSGPFVVLAIVALVAGSVLLALAQWGEPPLGRRASDVAHDDEPRAGSRHGGFVLVGPVPIVWGSDRRMAKWVVAGAGLALAAVLVFSLARR